MKTTKKKTTGKTVKKNKKPIKKKIQDMPENLKAARKKIKTMIELDLMEVNDIKQALYFVDDEAFDKYEKNNPKFWVPFRSRCRSLKKFFSDLDV